MNFHKIYFGLQDLSLNRLKFFGFICFVAEDTISGTANILRTRTLNKIYWPNILFKIVKV